MRKLSKTFLTVNAILSYVFAAIFGLCAIGFILVGALAGPEVAEEGGEAAGIAFTSGMVAGGVAFLYFAIMAIVSGVTSSKAKNSQVKKDLIIAIVFSALSCTWVGVAGGVTGIIANDKEARRDRDNNIVDAE